MTKTRSTKSALISSVIALLLCFTMLLGTTFAWFTDSVTSANNIIKSGTLKVEMYYADGSKAVPADDSSDWKNADGVAIYTANQLWEPGYTDAKHIKISNEGSLALKYQLAIIPTGTVSELAEVIDVYLYEIANTDANATQVATRDDVDPAMYVGTLADVISKGIVQGNLAADTDYTTTIVLKMREDAGNEYQDKSIGDDFTIQLLATQYTAEGDSFDDQYDKDAWVDGMQVYTASDLQAAINAGETSIKLMDDITLDAPIVIPAAATTFSLRAAAPATVIDLNGKKISGATASALVVNEGVAVIKNGTIENTAVNGGATINNKGTLTIDDANIVGAPIASDSGNPAYCITSSGVLTVEDGASVSADRGCLFLSGNGETVINGGTFTNNDISTKLAGRPFTSHVVVVGYGANNKLTINGGNFRHLHTSTSGGVVINNWSAVTVDVNGGNFSGGNYFGIWDNLSDYGYGSTNTPFAVTGGTFTGFDTNYLADGYHALQAGDKYQVVPESVDAIVSDNAELAAALQNNNTDEIILAAGEFTADIYNITARDTLIITGQGADTKLAFSNLQVRASQFKNLTISNCTIERMPNKSWGHLVFSGSGNANGVYTVSNCIFNGVGTQGIYINETVDGATYNIENCTFNGNFGTEGAITIQDNPFKFTVNVTDCEFNNIPETSHGIYTARNNTTGDGEWALNVDGKRTAVHSGSLKNAAADGAGVVYFMDGEYGVIDVCVGSKLTIMPHDGATVTFAGINGQSNNNASDITIKGITIDNSLATAGWYTGTAPNIKPCVGVWGGNYTFEDCTFFVTGESGAETGVMSWWTTNHGTMTFKDCTFNGGNGSARGMQIYGNYDLNVEDCTFTTAKDYSIKYVGDEGCKATLTGNKVYNTVNFVQTGSAPYAGNDYTLEFEKNVLATGINNVYVDHDENQTIIIDGKVAVATAEQLRALAATATGDVEVVLISDITLGNDTAVCNAVNFANATSVTIDGNGHSIIFKGKAVNTGDTSLDSVSGILSAGEITVKNVTLVNNKLSHDGTEIAGDRIKVYTVVRGTSVSYENVIFEGGVQVKNNTEFLNCTFYEDCLVSNDGVYADNGKFCVFVDFEYQKDKDAVCTVEFEGCTFNASGYGCVKLAGDGGATITANVKDCTFYNTCPSNSWSTTTPKYDVKCTGVNTSAIDLGGNTWAIGLANT